MSLYLNQGNLEKGIMPDLIDPNHTYVFNTGSYGVKDYWYVDLSGNYWRYTNAPEDHPDYDPHAGVPLLARNQPMPSTAPSFFTPEGRKRHVAVPPGIQPDQNPQYNPLDPKNVWYEVFVSDDQTRYVYLDADVRENLDLWVQYQLRVTDASLSRLRTFAYQLFQKQHPKDRLVSGIIMLMDQGLYEMEELLNATVGDVEFIDETVKLLGRKFLCDHSFLDFMTSLVGDRDKEAPLFQLDTVHGKNKIGLNHMHSIFHNLGISPSYLLVWHASHTFSRIVNRLAFEKIPPDEIEGKAFSELQRIFVTRQDVQFLVDYKVRKTLLENYKNVVGKALNLSRLSTDEFGTLMIFSDLAGRQDDEMEFSEWLHAEPMHDITPAEEAAVEAMVSDEDPSDGASGPVDTAEDEAVGTTDTAAQGADVGTTDVNPGQEE